MNIIWFTLYVNSEFFELREAESGVVMANDWMWPWGLKEMVTD